MRKLAGFLLVLVMSFSCIENDIPYPIMVADITSFEVEGQTKCDIDNKSREVAVEVDESVELSKLKLRSFVVPNDAEIVPTPSEFIDLSEPKTFKLVTYQEYLWTISAKQQIERFFKVTGQVGASIFDLVEKSVLVTMPESADLANLDVIDAKFEKLGSVITPDPKSVKNFRNIVSFNVKLGDTTYTWDVIVVKTESKVATGSVNPYAKYAVVSGAGQSGMKDPYFEYRKELFDNQYKINLAWEHNTFVPDLMIEQMNLYQISKKYKRKGLVNTLVNSNNSNIYDIFKPKFTDEYRHYAGKEKCHMSIEYLRNMLKQLDQDLYRKTLEKENEVLRYLL
jgi:hypothetical protein